MSETTRVLLDIGQCETAERVRRALVEDRRLTVADRASLSGAISLDAYDVLITDRPGRPSLPVRLGPKVAIAGVMDDLADAERPIDRNTPLLEDLRPTVIRLESSTKEGSKNAPMPSSFPPRPGNALPMAEQSRSMTVPLPVDVTFPGEVEPGQLQLAVRLLGRIARQRRDARLLQLANLRLRREAILDPLTGLWNRRSWQDRMQRAASSAVATEPCALAVIDLDGFKEVNDNHGHRVGDEVLRHFGMSLAETLNGDYVARIGGDEFGVIIFGESATDHDSVTSTLETTRRRASDAAKSATGVTVTASAGLATTPGATLDELWHHADYAMHTAKRAGRDCVVRHEA